MKNSPQLLCLSAIVLVLLLGLGCGSSSPIQPSVALVPTTHPLVAQYNISRINLGASTWVEFGPDTSYGRQTSKVPAVGSNILNDTVSILVAGMKPQTTYHMRAHAEWPGGSWDDQDRTFTTGALPSSLILPSFTVAAPVSGVSAKPAPGVELFSLIAPSNAQGVVTDLEGNIIWYCPGNAFPIKPLTNGHYIINTTNDLLEVDLTCNVIRDISAAQVNASLQANGYSFTIPPATSLPTGSGGQFHHDVVVMPNGHWIALCEIIQNFDNLPGYSGTMSVVGDALVDLDTNGNVSWAWSSFDHLDINRHLQGLPDWTHSNAIVPMSDGNLLVSMRNQSWILKIDYSNGTGSGDVLWRLGDGGDFTILGGDPSQWFYGQHYPNILSTNGSQMTLAVFDDGNQRVDIDGTACGVTPACYTRAATYQLDEDTKVADVLWQDLPGFYTFWGGSIGVLSNGDVEFDASEPSPSVARSSIVMEVTQTNTPQTVWQMNVTGENAYRGYRIPSLYPSVTWKQ